MPPTFSVRPPIVFIVSKLSTNAFRVALAIAERENKVLTTYSPVGFDWDKVKKTI